MRCDECLALLDQYVEGGFDEQAAQLLAEHVTACPGCARAHEALRREQEIYASYLLDVEASPALWAGLLAGIEREKSSNKFRSLTTLKGWVTNVPTSLHLNAARTAALLVVIAGITVGVLHYVKSDNTDLVRTAEVRGIGVVPPAPGSRLPDLAETQRGGGPGADIKTKGVGGPAAGRKEVGDGLRNTALTAGRSYRRRQEQLTAAVDYQPLPDAVLRQAERQYLTDISFLSRAASRRRTQFSHEALARLQETLAAIDQAIAETRHYVAQNPSDPVAVQHMMTAYSRKVEVLREVANS